jgi:UDP-N-acetylglucosamine acyltransferase
MGDDNRICEGAVLGGPPQDLRSCPDKSFLVIGNGNVFRENLTINRSSESDQATRIGNGNYFMAYSHVAHDCVIEDCIVLANNSLLAGFVRVEDHAFISGGVVVHQHNQIGRYSMIGGNSKVMQDALPFFLIDGFPARIRGLNTVGLERGGFSRAEVQALRQALRTLRQTGMKLEEKLEALAGADSESVGHLVDFIRRSTRGFCRVHR